MEEMSCTLFHLLDNIGYNQEIIKIRRNYWQQDGRIFSTNNQKVFNMIVAGSKGEGISSYFESDIDKLFLFHDAVCIDDVAHVARLQDMTVFYADMSESPPGYTRLKIISCNGPVCITQMHESMFESESHSVYVSSSLFAENFQMWLRKSKNGEIFGDISGPAVQTSSPAMLPADAVLAFHCYYPEILQKWKSRPRLHEWPPVDVREDAALMLAQVVPVGSKGSCDQWREWRFCFIQSELKLTGSLNETQLKLYIILKMVAKEILCDVSKEISSYIMKNITYWLSELLPGRVFRRENLITLLILSLRFLQSAICQWNFLPYYMIPGRNLLAERLTPTSRQQLSGLIEILLEEGPKFILRCTKIGTGLSLRLAAPVVLLKYKETRDRVEILMFCRKLLEQQNADFYYLSECCEEMCNTILPEWRMLLDRGMPENDFDNLLCQRIKAILE